MADTTYLRVREIATLLSVDRMTVYGWLWDGKIPYIKVGGIIRVKQEDLDAFVTRGKKEDSDG